MEKIESSKKIKNEIYKVFVFLPDSIIEYILEYVCLAVDLKGYRCEELKYFGSNKNKRDEIIKDIQKLNIQVKCYPKRLTFKLNKIEQKLHLINNIYMLIRKSDNEYHNIILTPGYLCENYNKDIVIDNKISLLIEEKLHIKEITELYLIFKKLNNKKLGKIKVMNILINKKSMRLNEINNLKLTEQELKELNINENDLC
tara:strand:- start:119 stop:718 length:600 start_codon:yes stop_codon:yes gene_type:complete